MDYGISATKLNDFLGMLGSDIGVLKLVPIFVSVICNIVVYDGFIEKHMDKNKSAWKIVGMELLYFVFETIDNYAGLCLGNVSQDLYDVSPIFSFVLALMFGQLYNSNLWVVANFSWGLICLLGDIMATSSASECITYPLSFLFVILSIPAILG